MKSKIFNAFLLSSAAMLFIKIYLESERNRKPKTFKLEMNKAMKDFIEENQSLFPQALRYPLNQL